MAFTYYYTTTGPYTNIIVLKDGVEVYRNKSFTATKEALLVEAKLGLKDNYPNQGVETMTEIQPPSPPPPLPSTVYTYYFRRTGFNIRISIEKDGLPVRLREDTLAADAANESRIKELLLRTAKLYLKENYPNPGIETMTEIPAPPPAVSAPVDTPPVPPAPPPLPTQNKPPVRNKLSKNKPKGKGLEGIVTSISKQLANIDSKIDDIYYGNKTKNTGIKLPGSRSKVNGILPIAQEISKIDLCNVLTYLLSNAKIPKDSAIGKKIKSVEEKTKALADKLAKSKVGSAAIKSTDNLKELSKAIADATATMDDDVISAVPQLANARNYLNDVNGTITAYSNLNTIPNADVQRILGKLNGVESTLMSIKTIGSAQDVLNIVQRTTGLNITGQLQRLQRIINPAQLLPTFKRISNTLRGINQIALKILNYIRILQVLTKVTTAVLKVLDIIRIILSFIPIPNIVTIVTITQKFSDALQSIKKFIETALKRVSQISALIELIYNFALGLVSKIGDLITVIDTLIFNLETCKVTEDSPVLEDLRGAKSTLQDTTRRLNSFIATYAEASKSGNLRVFNGLTLKIVEEEVVDEGVKNLRRKAIALDQRGVLVAETDLTFATDIDTLFEELQLLLRNRGIVNDTSPVEDFDFLGPVPTDQETYESVGLSGEDELIETSAEATAEVSNFIKGIKKGGKKFKRRIAQIVSNFATESAQALKDSARSGTFGGATPPGSKFAANLGSTTRAVTGRPPEDTPPARLSLRERDKWEKIARNENASGTIIPNLYPEALRKKAIEIIAKDNEAYES